MVSLYESPSARDLSFGDVFEGGFLYDCYVRGDIVPLGKKEAHKSLGEGLTYSTLFPQKEGEDFLLGHGKKCQAVVLSDSCAIDKLAGVSRQGRIRGRITLGAVAVATEGELAAEQEKQRYARFVLPAEHPYQGGIVDFDRLFALDLRDATKNENRRLVALTDEFAAQLETRWGAHLVRRGPFAAGVKSATSFDVFAEQGYYVPENVRSEATLAVARVSSEVWKFEGVALEDIGQRVKAGETPLDILATWAEGLRAISEEARKAIDVLQAIEFNTGAPAD
jgi:hypothetical protein